MVIERDAFVNDKSIFNVDIPMLIDVKDPNSGDKLKFWYHVTSNILMVFGDHPKVNIEEFKENND